MEMDKSEINHSNNPHIGQIICNLVKERELSLEVITAYLNIDEDELKEVYRSHFIDILKLVRFSVLLNTNLFVHYADHNIVNDLFQQANRLIGAFQKQQEELAQLRALNQAQRKIIEIMDTRDLLQDPSTLR